MADITIDTPYLANLDDLEVLGIDPEPFRFNSSGRGWHWAGYMLDRKKDAALIERLQSMNEQHGVLQ
jgi:hypothetical protein